MRPLTPLLLVLATCKPAARTSPPTVTLAADPSAAAPAPPPPPPSTCASLAAQAKGDARKLYAAARKRALDAGEAEVAAALEAAPPDLLGKCWRAPHGAWVTRLDSLETQTGWGGALQLRWTLDFVDETGARSSVFPTEHGKLDAGAYNFTVGGPDGYEIELVAYDFDGDGAPEIFVGISGKYHEGEVFAVGRLYTAGRGKVEPYAPAAGIAVTGIRDTDGDGRPDLVTSPFDAVGEGCGSGFGYQVSGPALVAHSLPGGAFSQTDAVAVAAARAACPSRPATLVPRGDEANTRAALMNVACARIHGATAAELLRALDRECKPPPASDPCAEHTCQEGGLLREVARREPPLVLR